MNRPFVGLLLTLFAGGVAATPIRTLLPAYVEGVLHQPPVLTSLLLSIQLGTGGLFALFAGALAARAGQRAVVLAGLTTPIVGAILLVLEAPPLLVLVALLWGIAAGFHSAGGQSFMIAAVGRNRLGTASAAYFLSSTAAGAAGAYAAGLAADHLGYSSVAVACVILGTLALALATRFLPNLDAGGGPGGSPPVSVGYADLLSQPAILALCLLRYLPTFSWGIASLAIPLLIFRLSNNSASTLGAYGTISLLCAAGAQLATGRLVDHRTARTSLSEMAIRPLLAPLTATIILSALFALIAAAAQNLPALIAAGTLWTMSAWALSTTMPPLIRELASDTPGGPDRLVGLAHLMWSAGMLSGTVSAGLLIEVSPVAAFLLAISCLGIALLCAVWVTSLRVRQVPA